MKVQKKSNGQYVITIRRGLAEALPYIKEGKEVEWKLNNKGNLELREISKNKSD